MGCCDRDERQFLLRDAACSVLTGAGWSALGPWAHMTNVYIYKWVYLSGLWSVKFNIKPPRRWTLQSIDSQIKSARRESTLPFAWIGSALKTARQEQPGRKLIYSFLSQSPANCKETRMPYHESMMSFRWTNNSRSCCDKGKEGFVRRSSVRELYIIKRRFTNKERCVFAAALNYFVFTLEWLGTGGWVMKHSQRIKRCILVDRV